MRLFAQLYQALDETTKTLAKVEALRHYFVEAEPQDKLWTIALLSGRRPKRPVNTTLLRGWAAEQAGVPLWLFEDSYHTVGDLAETISLLLPPASRQSRESLSYWVAYTRQIAQYDEIGKKEAVLDAWDQLDGLERFCFTKLITGSLRVGVSQKLMVKALSLSTGIEENTLAHRLMGQWSPLEDSFESLVLEHSPHEDISKPYPFYLAYQLEQLPEELGPVTDWQAERKWDGIRGQLIRRGGQTFIWSRGEELVTDKYPELQFLAEKLPDGTVIDGEILPWLEGLPLPFAQLQRRIGRKSIGKKLLAEVPVVLMAYDLLEQGGEDLRHLPLRERRSRLEALRQNLHQPEMLPLSPLIEAADWQVLAKAREESRAFRAEGLMLKKLDSAYRVGRKKGDWWKWKIDPLTIDAVMIYAQRGSGRRANLYTDFTFAVWADDDGSGTRELVPFTKAYSGLSDAEFRQLTAWVRKNTLERFGPVRSVTPEHVFEIAFEGIQESPRHKSGIALRFPRMLRWRQDKKIEEANTLADLRQLLESQSASPAD